MSNELTRDPSEKFRSAAGEVEIAMLAIEATVELEKVQTARVAELEAEAAQALTVSQSSKETAKSLYEDLHSAIDRQSEAAQALKEVYPIEEVTNE